MAPFVSHTTLALPSHKQAVLDYLSLTKPELTFLSTMTATAGFILASGPLIDWTLLTHATIGTWMVGAGAGSLNQVMERRYDVLMKRTENRPLPSGRLTAAEAFWFGCALTVLGLLELIVWVGVVPALIAGLTSATYLFLYTPLKRVTPLSILIGSVPGALPPLVGWTAARGELDVGAFVLVSLLFFWQMPHFLSLAWMYRKDYLRAGYRLVPANDLDGRKTGRHALLHACLLVVVSLVPSWSGLGLPYGIASSAAGSAFVAVAVVFARNRSNTNARRLFGASLLYLPYLLSVLMICRRFNF